MLRLLRWRSGVTTRHALYSKGQEYKDQIHEIFVKQGITDGIKTAALASLPAFGKVSLDLVCSCCANAALHICCQCQPCPNAQELGAMRADCDGCLQTVQVLRRRSLKKNILWTSLPHATA